MAILIGTLIGLTFGGVLLIAFYVCRRKQLHNRYIINSLNCKWKYIQCKLNVLKNSLYVTITVVYVKYIVHDYVDAGECTSICLPTSSLLVVLMQTTAATSRHQPSITRPRCTGRVVASSWPPTVSLTRASCVTCISNALFQGSILIVANQR